MEFTFEEKVIFGNQDFINCYFNVDFGCSSESGCLIADRRGVLYSPMISESAKIYLHRLNLIDVRNKNLIITCIYPVVHNKRSYIFVACEAVEGGGYCLISYCISNLEILESDNGLSSWQILVVNYKIMDLQSLTDENGNSVIILCGSDNRLHVYSLDARCIIRRKRKSNFLMSKIIEELLKSSGSINNCVSMAFPTRLYISKDKMSRTISDAFLGYSNGIALWFHSVCSPGPSIDTGNTIIQEIPLFHGSSNTSTGTGISLGIRASGNSRIRRNHSAFDLTEYGEKKYDLVPVDNLGSNSKNCLSGRERSRFSASMDDRSLSLSESKLEDKLFKEEITEHKTLLLDGIVTCLCFYLVPLCMETSDLLPSDLTDMDRLLLRMTQKPKKPSYTSSIVFGLASGSVLLACFEDVERPVSILPGGHKRGGVLSMTSGKISSSSCKDIFIGFHDGTVILMKLESSTNQNTQSPQATLDKIHFSVMWEIQLTYPVIGLSFGHFLGLNDQQSGTNINDTEKAPLVTEKKVAISSCPSGNDEGTEIVADQLAVVTTKSFHLFSLSLSIPPVLESQNVR